MTSLPLHASQKSILENDNEVKIEMELYLTQEFIIMILSYRTAEKVVTTEKLRKEIADCISKMGEKYEGRN